MIAQYTKIFSDFLEEKEDSQEWQNIKNNFDKFPTFEVGNNQEISLYNNFKVFYYNREIGSETDDIFIKNVERTLYSNILRYYQKIQIISQNFNDLYNRKIELSKTINTDETSEDENKYYLNPINSGANRLNNKDEYSNTFESEKTETYEILSGAMFKTNADLMKTILEINTLYDDIIRNFDICFMGVF